MESGNAPVNIGQKTGLLPMLPMLLPLPWSVGNTHPPYFQHNIMSERGPKNGGEECHADLSQPAAQDPTLFGIDCFICSSHLHDKSRSTLTNEARRHLFVRHAIVVTGLELERWFGGKKIIITKDTIFVR